MTRFSDEAAGWARVETGARLHLGFYRLCRGAGGRWLGGVGVGVEGAGFRLRLRLLPGAVEARGCQWERAARVASEAASRLGLDGLEVVVEECIPMHVGLGSTTQLVLAIYAGAAALAGMRVEDAIEAAGRSRYSGVGTGVFLWGGLVLDTGLGPHGERPRPMTWTPLPSSWGIVAVLPDTRWRVAEGPEEDAAMEAPGGLPRGKCAEAYEAVLGLVLPGAATGNFGDFVDGLETLDRLTGELFMGSQGGLYCCPEAGRAAELLRRHGARGVGQSSWGPLVYGWLPSQREARRLAAVLREILPHGWRVLLLRPRLRGALVLPPRGDAST